MGWTYQQKPPMGWPLDLSDPINEGLAGYWYMPEGSGNIIQDSSRNKRTGNLTGTAPLWVAGDYGSAIELPGTDERVEITNVTGITSGNPISIAFRAKCNVDAATHQGVMSIHDGTTAVFVCYFFNDDNGLCYHFGAYAHEQKVASAIDETVWRDYLITYDGSSSLLYLNGVNTALDSVSLSPAAISGKILISCGFSTDYYGDNTFSHVMMWNRILPASDAILLHQFPFYGFMNPDEIPLLDQYYTVGAPSVKPWWYYQEMMRRAG